jgi:predicted permease
MAWRALARRPGLFAFVVIVLGSGIGSAVAGFGILEAAQLRPLPFPDPDRLVQIGLAHESRPLETESLYRQDLLTFSTREDVIVGTGAFGTGMVDLSDEDRSERYEVGLVSPELFPLLGVQPAFGRTFVADDAVPEASVVVLISDEIWRLRFASDPDVVGRAVRIERQPATIVGVMPPGFAFPHRQRLWLPLTSASPGDAADDARVIGIARLAEDATIEGLESALEPLMAEAEARLPERYRGYNLRVQPLSWFFVDWQARAGQRLLFLAVAALLVLTLANASGLLLAHAGSREDEWAIRAALGAPRTDRLAAAVMTSVFVCAASLVVALPFAQTALTWLEGQLLQSEDPNPYFLDLGLTPGIIGFALGVAAVAVLATAIPAGIRFRARPISSGGGFRVAGSPRLARLAGVIVTLQVALSLVVVISMAVMVQGVEAMSRRALGVNAEGVLTARMALPASTYATREDRAAFWQRLAAFAGPESGLGTATVSSVIPGFTVTVRPVSVEGSTARSDIVQASWGAVDEHFLDLYEIDLVSGRDFDARDDADGSPVAVVDRRFADTAWPGLNPLGRRIRFGDDADWLTVVGVTGPLHLQQVDDPPRAVVLVPLAQQPTSFASVAVRVAGDPYSALPSVRSAVGRLDPDLGLYWVYSLPDAIRQGYANVRIMVRMISWLGLCALLLTAAGLYALLSGRVAQRTREIGIRRALGASSPALTRTVVGQVVVPLAAGLVVGLLSALPLARAIVALEPTVLGVGAGTYGMALLTLAVAAALAMAVPTVRALAVNPVDALRRE